MEKPLSQRAAADVKKRLHRTPKQFGTLQKPRMKAGFSFALLRDSQPPPAMGFLAVFCLRALSSPECHFPLAADFFQKARRLQFSLPVVSKSARQNVCFFAQRQFACKRRYLLDTAFIKRPKRSFSPAQTAPLAKPPCGFSLCCAAFPPTFCGLPLACRPVYW